MTIAFAPGKIILFGEHAVVYGRPAIAVPVWQVGAQATVQSTATDAVRIAAPDIGKAYDLAAAAPDDPLAAIIRLTCAAIQVAPAGFSVQIHSTLPVARGLGSGAAVSVAVARALGQYFGTELPPAQVSALAYEIEKLHHGHPSGVDNTTIAYGQALYFIRDGPIEPFKVARPFLIAIADTGVPSPTKIAVGDVRRSWEAEPERFERLFDRIGEVTQKARQAIAAGEERALGMLMNENMQLARAMGVSSPEIERLVQAALTAGALGAKLSGAGRGGNVIALVEDQVQGRVERALLEAGAARVIITRVE